MTKTEKIEAIIEAEKQQKFTDEINDVETLTYTDGIDTYTDIFNYIDVTGPLCLIYFIAGTGYKTFSIPIWNLNDKSVNELYNCIEK